MPKTHKHIYPMSFSPINPNDCMEFQEGFWTYITDIAIKDVEPGRYMVNKCGDIFDTYTAQYIRKVPNSRGYYYIYLYSTGPRKVKTELHRIVKRSFDYPPPTPDQNHIDHINCDKHCNFNWNLDWVTNGENCRRATFNDLYCMKPVFNEEEVHNICRMLKEGMHPTEIDKIIRHKYGNRKMSAHIHQIRNGNTWKYISKDYMPFPPISNPQRVISDDKIEEICQLIEAGFDNRNIANKLKARNIIDLPFDNILQLVRNVRSGHSYHDISSKYNFIKNKER